MQFLTSGLRSLSRFSFVSGILTRKLCAHATLAYSRVKPLPNGADVGRINSNHIRDLARCPLRALDEHSPDFGCLVHALTHSDAESHH